MWLHAQPATALFAALALAWMVAPALGTRKAAVHKGALKARRTLRQPEFEPQEDDALVRPLRFDQRLLVCNAYPSASPMEVRLNSQVLADEKHAIAFNECRYLPGLVKSLDKLDFLLQGQEFHGTFEVGGLPETDAVLLLVPARHPHSSTMVFQSLAFPTSADSKDAQLAVISTFKGNDTAPHLQVEDHITGKEVQTVSKRIEQLNFDRVYSVEEGAYDASVADRGASQGPARHGARKLLQLRKNQNYVVLRTGDEQGHFPESLVVFPETSLHSACRRGAALALLGLLVPTTAALVSHLW